GSDSQNLAFVSTTQADSTNDSVSTAVNVFAVGAKLSTSTLLNCEAIGSYDWSYQAEEEPTNIALMAFSSSSLNSSSDCEVSDSEEEVMPQVTKSVPSLAQSPELVKSPRHSGLISPHPMSVPSPVPLRPHSPSKGLRRTKKTCFMCKTAGHRRPAAAAAEKFFGGLFSDETKNTHLAPIYPIPYATFPHAPPPPCHPATTAAVTIPTAITTTPPLYSNNSITTAGQPPHGSSRCHQPQPPPPKPTLTVNPSPLLSPLTPLPPSPNTTTHQHRHHRTPQQPPAAS
nr:hypothetical protein [Tanacetum cinerariifolium]